MHLKIVLIALCCCAGYLARAQATCEKPIIPDVFTPNGDGFNDQWVMNCLIDFPDNTLTVYDRWGAQVYYAQGYDSNWDGTNASDNKDLPDGVYVYVLSYTDQQQKLTLRGTVTIVR